MTLFSTLLVVFALLFGFFFPGFIQSSTITITKNEIEVKYPQIIQFKLAAQSQEIIEKVVLHYNTNAVACQGGEAQQVVKFDADKKVDLKWDWDLKRAGALPPGAQITWYWVITDASGNSLRTEKQTGLVTDTRHTWKQLTSADERIVVEWYQGGQDFGNQLLRITQDSLARLSQKLGIESSRPIRLIVYPTSEELREVLLTSQEWTGGVARPDFGSVIFGAAPGDVSWLVDVIPHELAHLLIDELTFNCKGVWLPTWLNEGLAVNSEGDLSASQHKQVEEALLSGRLRPLNLLERGFSPYDDQARLEYDQSGYVVEFMLEQYGTEKMAELLAATRDGNKIDAALLKVYGVDTDGIDSAWRVSLGAKPLPTALPTADPLKNTPIPTRALPTSPIRATATQEPEPLTPTPLPATVTPEKLEPTQPEPTLIKLLSDALEATPVTIRVQGKTAGGFPTIYIILIVVVAFVAISLVLVGIILKKYKR